MVTQVCVVTVEPFDVEIDEHIKVTFVPEEEMPSEKEIGSEFESDLDAPDVLENGIVDLGAVITEYLALSLDPYPRKPGAEFSSPEESRIDTRLKVLIGRLPGWRTSFAARTTKRSEMRPGCARADARRYCPPFAGPPDIQVPRPRTLDAQARSYCARRHGRGSRPFGRCSRGCHRASPQSGQYVRLLWRSGGHRAAARRAAGAQGRLPIVHTDVAVRMDDKPSQALRQGRQTSSMWLAIDAVKSATADVAVSAGNTGALMAMATVHLAPWPASSGRRSPLSGRPRRRGRGIVLDMGATIGADARQLVDFAVMGAAMAKIVFDLDRPTIGLLNVGVEEMKGVEQVGRAPRLSFANTAQTSSIAASSRATISARARSMSW